MTVPDYAPAALHNIEAERYVLAACLSANQAVEDVAEVLHPEDFYRPLHQDIFHAMIAMLLADEPITPVTLLAWLRRDKVRVEDMYVADLFALPATGVQAVAHARIVWDAAIRRRIDEAAIRMQQLAPQPGEDPADLIKRALAFLEGVSPHTRRALTLDEFMAQEGAQSSMLIPGLLARCERVILVAPEGSGKTEVGYQVAFGLAAGLHPFALTPMPAGRALLIDFENPLPNLQRRLSRFRAIASQSERWHPGNVAIYARTGGIDITRQEDAFELAEVIRRFKPDIVVGGPVYKMFDEGDDDRAKHRAITRFFDRERQRHGIAVWLETHAPIGLERGKRTLRPEGSGIWSKWPEFGIALATHGKDRGTMLVGRFRGDRERGRCWPEEITRNRMPEPCWPWTARFAPGTFDVPL